jgi:Phospholipase_D-nuclease N-terminal
MMHMLLAADAPARHGHTLFLVVLPIIVLAIAFDVYCLVDLIRSPSARYLPKPVWGLIIVLVSAPWGGLIYLFVGRDRGQRRSASP